MDIKPQVKTIEITGPDEQYPTYGFRETLSVHAIPVEVNLTTLRRWIRVRNQYEQMQKEMETIHQMQLDRIKNQIIDDRRKVMAHGR